MPVINRIRIANINYDGKYIGDEIFDTYDGENTLLNLKNGSGKSVLVQLMLQPIIPCISIHGRKIESYLQQNKPSVIMLEWKLDNTPVPTYFLTALVMRLNASDEKSSSRINYFTFVNRYTEACEYDIANLPLISHESGGISIKPYNECRNAVKNIAKPNSALNYFSSDDDSEYKAKQEQNGIFPDEWRLIARCNEEEGGISKMLENIKTSDRLFNEWILKTIVTNVSSGSALTDMFFALIKSINENDKNIRYRDILENFLIDNNGYVDNLEKLMEQCDSIEKQRTKIADIYHFLDESKKWAEDAIENCNSMTEYNRKMIKHIDYEELSYEYYNTYEQYISACDEYDDALAAKEKAQKNADEAKRYVALLNAVELYNDLKKEKARENSAKEELRRMGKGSDPDRYNNLVFSLLQCYSEQISELNNKKVDIQQTYDKYVQNRSDLRAESIEIGEINNKLSSKIGELRHVIKTFTEYENTLIKELDVFPVYTLDGEIDMDSIKEIRKSLSEKKKQLENDIDETENKIIKVKNEISALEKEKEDLGAQRTEISVKLNDEEHKKKEYEENEQKALMALDFFVIDKTELFNITAVRLKIEAAERTNSEKLSEYKLSLRRQEQYLEAVKAGTVHISPELSAELNKCNIDFTTGEEYLLSEPNERRAELLAENPMLPFSYIVDSRNLDLIRNAELHGYADKAIPIITYENIGSASAVSAKITEMSEKSLLLCLYNERCIDNEGRSEYIKELEERLTSTNKNITLLENETREFAKHKAAYYSFNYSRTFYAELVQGLAKLNEKNELIKKRFAEIPVKISECNNTIDEAEKTAHDLNIRLEKNIENTQRFDEYLKKHSVYLNNKKTLSNNEEAVAHNKARLKIIDDEVTTVQNKIDETKDELSTIKSSLSKTQCSLSALDDTVVGKRLSLPLDQLEQEYRFVTDNVKSTREKLENEIADAQNKAEKYNQKLKRLNIPFEEYSDPSLIFSDELLEYAENAAKTGNSKLSECEDKLNKSVTNKEKLCAKAESKKENLERAGYREPLERTQIKMSFDERKSELLEKIDALKKELSKYSALRENCALKAAALRDHFVDKLHSGKYLPADVSEINTDELKKSLNEMLTEKYALEQKLKTNYETVHQKYAGRGYEAIDAFINNMIFDESDSFDDFFEVFDHIKECQKCLEEELELIKSDLEQLENKKTNFIRHALEHAQKIYSEVKNISNLSKIRIDGKPRQMLVIGVPENADSQCEENMRAYLDNFLNNIRSANDAEPLTRSKLLQKIENAFSDRELLNIVIGKKRIDVSLYKVDVTGNNGRVRTWEEVLVENSGAQKFVSAFAFVSTLMEYTRSKRMEKMVAEKMFGKKVFILDNPFSATSSDEYLNVMQALSVKFNIQLICLSDLHQSSITNKFNVFYQLVLRNSLYANRASLKIDSVDTSGDIHKNIKLEHVVAKIEQITFF